MAIKFVDKETEAAAKPRKVIGPKTQPQAESEVVDHTDPTPDLPFGKPAPKKGRR